MLLYYREEKRRADSGRRHHRSRLDGVVYRRRHRLRQLQSADGSLLHLLLDVRLPAHRRHGVGVRRRARQGLPDGRHRRPHHAGRRRLAAPGRTQPGALQHRSHLPQLRSGVRVRDRGDRAGRHAAHVSSRAKTASTTSPCTTKTMPMPEMPAGARRRHPARHLQVPRRGEGQGRGATVRQRPDPQRSAARAADSGGEVRRRRRCLERDQLQRAAPRCPGD